MLFQQYHAVSSPLQDSTYRNARSLLRGSILPVGARSSLLDLWNNKRESVDVAVLSTVLLGSLCPEHGNYVPSKKGYSSLACAMFHERFQHSVTGRAATKPDLRLQIAPRADF
jgi:hypothetical protein